jgi:hypothetical protein
MEEKSEKTVGEPLQPIPDPITPEPVLERSLFRFTRSRSILRPEEEN